MFGLEEKHWSSLKRIALDPLAREGARLWVFGSRATGQNKKFSDIDILIESQKDLPDSFLAKIRYELEESDLPINVDLVLREDLAESYAENIDQQKILI